MVCISPQVEALKITLLSLCVYECQFIFDRVCDQSNEGMSEAKQTVAFLIMFKLFMYCLRSFNQLIASPLE